MSSHGNLSLAPPARIDILGVGISAIDLPGALAQTAALLDRDGIGYVCVTGGARHHRSAGRHRVPRDIEPLVSHHAGWYANGLDRPLAGASSRWRACMVRITCSECVSCRSCAVIATSSTCGNGRRRGGVETGAYGTFSGSARCWNLLSTVSAAH